MSDQDWGTASRRWSREYESLSIEQLYPHGKFAGYIGFTQVGEFKTLKAAKAPVDRAYAKKQRAKAVAAMTPTQKGVAKEWRKSLIVAFCPRCTGDLVDLDPVYLSSVLEKKDARHILAHCGQGHSTYVDTDWQGRFTVAVAP